MRMNKKLARGLAVLAFALSTLPAAAQVPRTLSYQGYLASSSGQPFPNSAWTISFRLYAAPTGGSFLWSESQVVETSNGAFSTTLGSVNPFDPFAVPFNQPYYLEIEVNGASGSQTLSPRQPLTSAPYAIRADGLSPSSCQAGSFVSGFNALGAPVCSSVLQLGSASCSASAAGTLQWNDARKIVEVCDGTFMRAATPIVASFSGTPTNPVSPGALGVMNTTFTYQPQYTNSTITVWAECNLGGAAAFSNITLMYGFGSNVPTTNGLGPSQNGEAYHWSANMQLLGLMPTTLSPFTLGIQIENPPTAPIGGPNLLDAICGTVKFRVIETP
jgi:hypothetical protein